MTGSFNSQFKKKWLLISALIFVLGIAVIQDFLRSRYLDHRFYASESILFNLFWILLLPISLGFRWLYLRHDIFRFSYSQILQKLLFIGLAILIHLVLNASLIHFISWLFFEPTFSFFGNLEYSISEELYLLIFAYSLISLVVFRELSPSKKEESAIYLSYLAVSNGRINARVSVEEILYLSTDSPYLSIHCLDRKYLQLLTLKGLLSQLEPRDFVQIHKSTAVNLQFITSYHSRGNGDYDIQLSNGEQLRLSRNYVDNFRKKFEGRSSGQTNYPSL